MRLLLVAVAAHGVLAAVAGAAPSFSNGAAEGCTVLLDQAQSSPQQRPEQGREQPPSVGPPSVSPTKKVASEALKAPQDAELEELGDVLKALADVGTAPAALADLGAGRPFSLERFGVLVADVRSIVVQLHSRELRTRLGRSRELNAETRQWIDQRVRVMEECAPGRFENRGGPVVFEQVAALVGKHRALLEPFLFQTATPQAAQPAPRPQQRKQGR